MKTKKTKAIVLRKVLYKEHSLVLTLFSETEGLFSLFVRRANKKQSALFNPFSEAEFFYSSKNNEQFFFTDASLIDLHLDLREEIEFIETASKMVRLLLKTQLQGKSSPKLFQLFSLYLKKIPKIEKPSHLYTSFILKLLFHDGQLALSQTCSRCKNNAQGLFEGESFCKNDLPSKGIFFTETQWKTLLELLNMRNFDQINLLQDENLEEKITKIFL